MAGFGCRRTLLSASRRPLDPAFTQGQQERGKCRSMHDLSARDQTRDLDQWHPSDMVRLERLAGRPHMLGVLSDEDVIGSIDQPVHGLVIQQVPQWPRPPACLLL